MPSFIWSLFMPDSSMMSISFGVLVASILNTPRATVENDDRGRVELYADRARGVLVGAAAVGLYAEEWMSEITLAIRAL